MGRVGQGHEDNIGPDVVIKKLLISCGEVTHQTQ